ncbi:uncharacterized protein LOC144747193 [Ciona intestinalis]
MMKFLFVSVVAFATLIANAEAKSENRIKVKTIVSVLYLLFGELKTKMFSQFNEITVPAEGENAFLYCEYSIASGADLPVTVTWKVGDGPRYATSIYECTGYTNSAKTCSTEQVFDPAYEGRIKFEQNYLFLASVQASDNRNYWCQVALEGSSEQSDEEFDMKSIVLEVVYNYYDKNLVTGNVQEDSVQQLGKEMVLHCDCFEMTSTWCEDVYWYKGPTDPDNSNYELIYSRWTSHSAVSPETFKHYQAYGDWEYRTVLSGNSLIVTTLKASDAGRYWCEVRTAGYRNDGEWGTDARSTVVEIV